MYLRGRGHLQWRAPRLGVRLLSATFLLRRQAIRVRLYGVTLSAEKLGQMDEFRSECSVGCGYRDQKASVTMRRFCEEFGGGFSFDREQELSRC
jgi:hypothetical protein